MKNPAGEASRSASAPALLPWLATALAAAHLALVLATGLFRPEHLFADALLGVLAWAGPGARRFLKGGIALWLTGTLLDNQRLWIHLRPAVHTGDLVAHEKALFGVNLAEWFASHTHVALDVLCGLGYATYLFEFFALLVVLFWRRDARFERMAWTFFAVNLIGCITYVLYPAAPPWYVMMHGPGPADLSVAGSAAGAARFDALIGVGFFKGFYSRNPNVFGAMPSLHTAYPTVALWQVWHLGKRWRIPAALFAGLIGFSAVYLQHHYILDVVGGVAAALLACTAVDALAALLKGRGVAEVGALATEGETHD
nr:MULTISPECIES: phosphatase PAP2 family protein [Myxococcaceae]